MRNIFLFRNALLALLFLCPLIGVAQVPTEKDCQIMAAFIIAPMQTEHFTTYGDCMAPCESENGNISYVAGPHITLTPISSTTGIESVNMQESKQYYCILGGSLKALQPVAVYSLDGKIIARVKANDNIDLSIMPEMFIVKFNDSISFKVAKNK